MNKNIVRPICISAAVYFALIFSVAAETKFIDYYRDGIWTYAIIEHNGNEYRTDQMGPRFNQILWENLSEPDRRKLISAYSYKIGARRKDFGNDVSGEMADWINNDRGWTAAAEALKQRHMEKTYPELAEAFGPGVYLNLPSFYSSNPEIVNSDDYKEALRLAAEIQADFEVGREIHNMLKNARWEQISIAVKTLSEPLIKMIVDNFITGFVTNGASKVSELAVNAYNFANDLKDFITSSRKAGGTPPTPIDIINRLEQYMGEMEQTGNTAISLISDKKARLQTLADSINAADAQLTAEYQAAAAAKRAEFSSRTNVVPEPANLDEFTGTDAQIRQQAEAYYKTLSTERNNINNTKIASINNVTTKYAGHINRTPILYSSPFKYLAGASDGFSSPYFEVNDPLPDVTEWKDSYIPSAVAGMGTSRTVLEGAESDVTQVLDNRLPEINDLHARARWLYQNYSGFLMYWPISTLNFTDLRNFDTLVNVAATNERTVENLLNQITAEEELASLIEENLETGISKRREWINSEWQRYDSLRFNAENSLSYVIAALRQLDRLRSDPYFLPGSPYACYGDVCLYRYSVNVDAIKAEINAFPSVAGRVEARARAVARLYELMALEETLIERLEIAQNAHINDIQALEIFFSSVASRFPYGYSRSEIIEEFRSVTGKTMKNMYDIWNDLVPDITYYYTGSSNNISWIRNRNRETTPFSIRDIENISGKIPEYYELLDLYNDMKVNKSYYMNLSEEDFSAFMTDVKKKVGQAPDGSYITAFKTRNVWGVEFPYWQLGFKFNDRLNRLEREKRYNIITEPNTYEVGGSVTGPGGEPVSGAHVLLTGYLNLSTTTRSDGTFVFDFISNGDYSIKVFHEGYEIPAPMVNVVVDNGDTSPEESFTAIPKEDPGYVISGRLAYENGNAVSGAQVILVSSTGVERTAITSSLGVYSFTGVEMDEYIVRPADSEINYLLPFRAAVVPMSVEDADFLVVRGPAGDLNSDKSIDLKDAILAIQVSTGIVPEQEITLEADVNNDGVIDMAEAIYIFQIIAGYR